MTCANQKPLFPALGRPVLQTQGVYKTTTQIVSLVAGVWARSQSHYSDLAVSSGASTPTTVVQALGRSESIYQPTTTLELGIAGMPGGPVRCFQSQDKQQGFWNCLPSSYSWLFTGSRIHAKKVNHFHFEEPMAIVLVQQDWEGRKSCFPDFHANRPFQLPW